MGYFGVMMQAAFARGVTSIPTRIPTGYAVFTPENVDDPAMQGFVYSSN